MRHFLIAGATVAFSVLALGQASGQHGAKGTVGRKQGSELAVVKAAADSVNHALHLAGSGLTVVRPNHELHRSLHGKFSGEQVLPIGSASMWLTAATIMSLVDDEKLDLDLPVARYIKEFDRDDRDNITLRQCLSHISGLPAQAKDNMKSWDMQRFAKKAGREVLRSYPGTSFIYGDVGVQVAAVVAERVTGKSWHELFAKRIAEPLGMRSTKFGTVKPLAGDAGTTPLPWAGRGAVSTLNDYTRFVRMLLAKGEWHGKTVLSQESVAEILRNQVPVRIDITTHFVSSLHVRYGFGTWLETMDKGLLRLSDPGEFGFTPWLDPDLEVGGVFAVKDRWKRIKNKMPRIHAAVRQAVLSPTVAGTSEAVTLHHDHRNRHYGLHVPPHDTSHAGLPLLLVLHGSESNGDQVREMTGLDKLGVRHGFVVAFPDGTGHLRKKLLSWNAGGGENYASRNKIDDVGFLKDVVIDVQKRVSVDPDRIYVVGYDNGGMMCHRLARQAADVFDGIAVVAGSMDFTEKGQEGPIAAILIHGTNDQVTLIKGGKTNQEHKKRIDSSMQDAIDYYLQRNGLLGYPTVSKRFGVSVDVYDRGRDDAATMPMWVVKLAGGGHAWPGSSMRSPVTGDKPVKWPATRAILAFLSSLHSHKPAK